METLKIKTSWGTIALTLDSGKVVGCALPLLKNTPPQPFKAEFSEHWKREANPHAMSSNGWKNTDDFFQCLESSCVAAQVKNLSGTKFQKAVWNELLKIPCGQTRTYGEIAAAIGRPNAARAVGSACGANPIPLFIPCHRVVAKNGLGGFGPGLPWKNLLLELEGAVQTGSVS